MMIILYLATIIVLAMLLFFIVTKMEKKYDKFLFYVILRSREAMVIERLGKFNRVIYGGIHFLIPIIDKPRTMHWRFSVDPRTGEKGPITVERHRIDLRETIYDFAQQVVITKDNAKITIDGLILVKIHNPDLVVYNVSNFPATIENLVEAGLRNVIGTMNLHQTITSREEINYRLKNYLRDNSSNWGVYIRTVEIKNIIPDKNVFKSMVLETVEEHRKIAAIYKAEAEKITLETLKSVIGNTELATQYLATIKYIDAFKTLVNKKDEKVVFIPYDAGKLISSLGSVGELFTQRRSPEFLKRSLHNLSS